MPGKPNVPAASCATVRPGSPEFLRRFRARTGRQPAADGRWSLVAPAHRRTRHAQPNGAPLPRNSFWRAMASSCAKPPSPKTSPAATPLSIQPSRPWKRTAGSAAACSSPGSAPRNSPHQRRRHAAQPAHRTRTSRGPASRRIGSRQSLRQPAAVARRKSRDGTRRGRQHRPHQRPTHRIPAPPQSVHPRHSCQRTSRTAPASLANWPERSPQSPSAAKPAAPAS